MLALVALLYVDEANLSEGTNGSHASLFPLAAILIPAASFLSVLSPDATEPNGLIYLAYVGAVFLAIGLITLGIGLIRKPG